MNERGNHSEDTARKIDVEVKQILSDAHNEARRVLRERVAILDELSRRLLEKEVIEGDELRALIGPIPPKHPDGTVPPVVLDPGPGAD
jgi:cell division protease FtsH